MPLLTIYPICLSQ